MPDLFGFQQVLGALGVFERQSATAMRAAANDWARSTVEWEKSNKPWTDRTGAARAGLKQNVGQEGQYLVVTIYGDHAHNYWLELAHAGAWGIIYRAVRERSPQLLPGMQRSFQSYTGLRG